MHVDMLDIPPLQLAVGGGEDTARSSRRRRENLILHRFVRVVKLNMKNEFMFDIVFEMNFDN